MMRSLLCMLWLSLGGATGLWAQTVGEEFVPEEGQAFALSEELNLWLWVEEGKWRAVFRDADNLVVAPPIESLTLRGYPRSNRSKDFFLVLRPEGGAPVFQSPRFFAPPHAYYIALILPGMGEDGGNRVIDQSLFQQ